jgi:hypothetical protein
LSDHQWLVKAPKTQFFLSFFLANSRLLSKEKILLDVYNHFWLEFMHAQIDVQTDGQRKPFGQNRKMLLIYHFNGDREVIEEKNFKYSQKV